MNMYCKKCGEELIVVEMAEFEYSIYEDGTLSAGDLRDLNGLPCHVECKSCGKKHPEYRVDWDTETVVLADK
jgi:uncharacterized Zn finger protein